MKTSEEFQKAIFEKYEKYQKGEKSYFFQEKYEHKMKVRIVKKVAIFLVCILGMASAVYAGAKIYEKVWQEPEKYNYKEEKEVTWQDKQEAMTEEEAIQKAREWTEGFDYSFGNIVWKEIIKHPESKQMYWRIMTDNNIDVQMVATTGALKSFSVGYDLINGVKPTCQEQEARKIAQDFYGSLGYKEGEYQISSCARNLIEEDTSYWVADFCKVYDGLVNQYECVRIGFVPETNQFVSLNLFNTPTENNEVKITKQEAVQVAKQKEIENRGNLDKLEKEEVELSFEKMNMMHYHPEESTSQNVTQMPENTTVITSTEEEYYRVEEKVRKVWKVVLTFQSDFCDVISYYVDATTGEIIGGDAMK